MEAHCMQNILEMDVDQNNNNICNKNNRDDNKTKLTYELPSDNKCYVQQQCICQRPHKVFECERCHQYLNGRISEVCVVHPMDVFLMDFHYCPYCFAPTTDIKLSNLTCKGLRNIEDAPLPNDEMDDVK